MRKEKWSVVKIHIDSKVVANGLVRGMKLKTRSMGKIMASSVGVGAKFADVHVPWKFPSENTRGASTTDDPPGGCQ